MSGLPIDQRRQLRWSKTRDTMWAAMRELKEFTVRDIEHRTHTGHRQIRDYVQALVKAGYLKHCGERPIRHKGGTQAKVYRLIRDAGVDAPRVRRDGTEVTQGSSREQMWRTMRIIKAFNADDLAVQASTEEIPVSREDARDYLGHLHKAGYLAVTVPAKPGTLARYRFLPSRYTGPKPPMVQRVKQVWDPNIEKVMWPRPESGASS